MLTKDHQAALTGVSSSAATTPSATECAPGSDPSITKTIPNSGNGHSHYYTHGLNHVLYPTSPTYPSTLSSSPIIMNSKTHSNNSDPLSIANPTATTNTNNGLSDIHHVLQDHQSQAEMDHENNGQSAGSEEGESIDVTISNVVCNFSVHCHLNLKQIAQNGFNVVYKRDQGVVIMKLRCPHVTASIWSSGRILITGPSSEEVAKKAARRVARILQKMGFKVKFGDYRIVNVLGSVNFPFGIRIDRFAEENRSIAQYEPEIHPGAECRLEHIGATLRIFQTGSITLTAPSVEAVSQAVEHIYPVIYEHRKPKPQPQGAKYALNSRSQKRKRIDESKGKSKRKKKDDSGIPGFVEEDDAEDLVNDSSEEEPEAQFTDEEEGEEDEDYSDNSNL